MRRSSVLVALVVLCLGAPGWSADVVVGHYRLAAGPDTAAELLLRADGQFAYALEEGALDEHAEGRWTRTGDALVLATAPKPVPPLFQIAPRSAPAPNAPTLRVTLPNGRGIGGVEFRVGFDSGDPIVDYTQESGWTMPAEEHRIPCWIELVEPIHGIISPRYPITGGMVGTLNFVIVPHDIGVVDFSGVRVDILPGGLLVHRGQRQLQFVRDTDAPDARGSVAKN